MPTITVKATAQCSSGGHVTLTVTGDYTATLQISPDEVRSALVDFDRRDMLLKLLRLHFLGKTLAEVRNELTSPTGVVFTI